MRRILLLTVLLLLPLSTFAEQFSFGRAIESASLERAVRMFVELDKHALENLGQGYRVVDDKGMAVGANIMDERVELMGMAIFDKAPPAANTVQSTALEALKDFDGSTYFQPKKADSYVFLFHFPTPIHPVSLALDTEGRLESVKVRSGMTASTLSDATTGEPAAYALSLSGEQARYIEVTIKINEGVLRISNMSLLEPSEKIIFVAEPMHTYHLLYGSSVGVHNPDMDDYHAPENMIEGRLGKVFTLSAKGQDDHDGVDASIDVCPLIWDVAQRDGDGDGKGDMCDNCVDIANPDQMDGNGNAWGDACEDPDLDLVATAIDNCPNVSNPRQQDEDKDGIGNVCDPDDDRWSEDRPWLLYASMFAIVVVLVGLGAVILRRSSDA